MIIGRAIFDILVIEYSTPIQQSSMESEVLDFIAPHVRPGVTTAELDAIVAERGE